MAKIKGFTVYSKFVCIHSMSTTRRKIFYYKVLNISGNINLFLYRKSMFLLLTSVVRFVRCRQFYDTPLAIHCILSVLYVQLCCIAD